MMIRKKDILLGVLSILLYCTPYVILGADAYITIHDFLDLTIGHLKNITNNDLFFSLGSKVPVMDGISRMAIPYASPFDIKNLIFFTMPNYWGIIVSMLIIKYIAFLGMYLLLTQYIVNGNRLVSLIVSILFSLIPFYIDYSLSSAGIPLLAYSLINLYYGRFIKWSFFIICFYAFSSSLALSGLFVCIFLFLFIIGNYFYNHKFEKKIIAALFLLSVIYICTNWELLSHFFFSSGFKSSRVEMLNHFSFEEILNMCLSSLRSGSYHAGLIRAKPIIVVFIFVLLFFKDSRKKIFPYFICYAVLSIFIVAGTFMKMLPIGMFSAFQFDRFYFLYSSMCYILLAKSLEVFIVHKKYILPGFVVCMLTYNTFLINTEFCENLTRLFSNEKLYKNPSYSQFYDEKIFKDISMDLKILQDYSTKVLSIGMYPSIAEYNGFYCLDGYMSSYSLDYKHRFREIIRDELEKNSNLKLYFDEWGNRCYVFPSELGSGFLFGKNVNIELNNFKIDMFAAKKLGCEYIFSSVWIKNPQKIGLKYINHYTSDDSFWDIKVYGIL